MTDDELLAARARAGRSIRELGHAFIGRHATIEQVQRLTEALDNITTELWPQAVRSREQFPVDDGERPDIPQGRFNHSFDDRPISGTSSPWGLDLELHRHGDEIEALVMLRAAHEGAPGRAHGGVVAALFDDVFGFVLGVLRQAAFTGGLSIRYEAPTPLHRTLACRVRPDHTEGRKLYFVGELVDIEADLTVATATATFISVDRAAFEQQTAERPPPPNEP